MIILDTSAGAAMALQVQDGEALKSLMLIDEEVLAPDLYVEETCNTFWKLLRAGQLEREQALQLQEEALGLVDRFVPMHDLSAEVLCEAARLNHPAYDVFYLVLARRMAATLYTLDKKLIELCEANGVSCIHVEAV